MAKLIHPNGATLEVKPRRGRVFQLDELYKLLKCSCIETASIAGIALLCDTNELY
jgi:hypothetical protein